jgi:hypothetical protein
MLLLLAIPVFAVVAFAHRFLLVYAPSNVLIAHLRLAYPAGRRAVALGGLAFMLTAVAHALTVAIEGGAAGWLNLVVLVLLWDAIKFAVVAGMALARTLLRVSRALAS